VRGLLSAAGFQEVRIEIEVGPIRYPSPSEFLRQEASCSPLAGMIGAIDEAARAALVRELEVALRSRCDDLGVVFPIETYLARAAR
jgi:hypothetical protein